MRVTLIAIHQDINNNVKMVRLLDEDTNEIKDFPCDNVKYVLQSKKLSINGITLSGGKLKGSNGSFDRYPTFIDGVLTRNNKRITILATIDDIGYRVSDAEGHIIEASTNALLEKREQGLDVANGKIVEKNGVTFFSAINGNYPNIPVEQSPTGKKWIEAKKAAKQQNEQKSIQSEVKSEQPAIKKQLIYNREKDPRLPRVLTGVPRADSKLKEIDPVTGMTVEQKMTYTMLGIQTVRPFYYSILALLKRVEASNLDNVDTMAVSLDTLYFSSEFVRDISLSDLMFVMLHEVCHIAMKHRIRENGRDHDAWNYATDYFINRHLAEEFGLDKVGVPKKANLKAYSTEYSTYDISIPEFGLYNQAVNVDKDTPETIYGELQNQQNQQQQNQQSNQNNQGQQSNQGQQGNQDNQNQQNQNQQGQQSQGQQSQGQQGGQQNNAQQQVAQSAQQMAQGMQQIQQSMNNSSNNQSAQQQINQGMQQVQQGAQQMNSGMQNGSKEQVEQGAQQMQNGLDQIESGINQMNNSQEQNGNNSQQAKQQAKQGLEDMKKALEGLKQGAEQACDENNSQNTSSNSENQGENEPKYNESNNGNEESKGNAHNKSGGTQSIDDMNNTEGSNDSNNYETGDDSSDSHSNYDASQQRKQGRFAGKEFRGQSIPDVAPDMVDDNSTVGKTPEQLNQAASSLLSQAVTIHKQRHSFGGDTPDFLERYVEQALAPKVNWRSVLKRYLTKASQKEYTFAHPDKRFLTRRNPDGSRQVFAGPHMADAGELENIKICIDTSGSITPKDIGQALSQIEDMFKQYKADAELIYWDTRVRAVYPFKQYKELLSKEPMGGGGTDANCIFDFFETNKDYKLHKKPVPSLIIIFTDGYFGEVDGKYKRKYKNTIWIIHDNDKFKAPFGVKAPLKISDI